MLDQQIFSMYLMFSKKKKKKWGEKDSSIFKKIR